MAIIITAQNTLETGLANGTAMTAGPGGNTGGAAGTYFPNVFASSNAAMQYSSALAYGGTLSANAHLAGGTGATFGWRPSGSPAELYFRCYVRFSAFHSGTVFVVDARDNATTASGFSMRLSSTGLFSVYKRSATSATLATVADAIATDTWYRLEGRVTVNGTYELRIYPGESLVLYTPAISGTGVGTALTFYDYLNFGVQPTSGTATLDAYFDNVAYSTVGWIGPAAASPARPLTTVADGSFTCTGKPNLHEATSDASDATYARSPLLSGTPSVASVRLSELGAVNIKFQAKLRATTSPGVNVTVTLYEGASLIASRTVTDLPATATQYQWALTSGEEAAINNRDDLRIEVSGVA